MAGPTVARAEIQLDFDGSRLPAEAKAIAEKAGKDSGFGFTDGFSKGLSTWSRQISKDMIKSGKVGGKSFSQALKSETISNLKAASTKIARAFVSEDMFRGFAREVGGADEALRHMTDALQNAFEAGDVTEAQVKRHQKSIEKWITTLKKEELALAAEKKAQEESAAAAKEANEERRRAAEEQARASAAMAEANRRIREENQKLAKSLKDVNLALGSQKNWNALIRDADDSGEAVRRFEERLKHLADNNVISADQFTILSARVREFTKSMDDSADSMGRHNRIMELGATAASKVQKSWQRMDSTVRLVIGLIVSGASDVAALGSAVGAGIVGLGAAITQLIPAAFGIGTVFNRLSQDLETLPPSMRAVASEFIVFKQSLGDIADVMAGSAFAQMDGVWLSLRTTLRGLAPALSKVGDATGQVFREFADVFKVGSEGFSELNELIGNSADSFLSLSSVMSKFTVAFFRAFNGAQPLVEDLWGWLDRLATQFDKFTRSASFDDWISDAQSVFGSLSGVLDATGRALNDLADPAAVDRLVTMLDNLAKAIPGVFAALNVVSVLDPLGLLIKALADLSVALEPLFDPLEDLANAISDVIGAGIDILAPMVTVLATALAGLISAVPPELLIGIATAILTYKAVGQIVPVLQKTGTAFINFGTQMVGFVKSGEKMKGLGKGLGLAAIFTGLASAMAGANQAASLTVAQLSKVDAAFKSSADGGVSLASSFDTGTKSADELRSMLDYMYTSNFLQSGAVWKNVADGIDGITFGLTDLGAAWDANEGAFTEWGKSLAGLASTDVEAAQTKFKELADSVGGGDEQIKELLSAMPDYEAALRDAASAAGITLSDQDLLNAAVGEFKLPASQATRAAEANADALAYLQGKAVDTSGAVDELADAIRGFGDAHLTTRDAARAFQQDLDDLTASITENGKSLDITTEAGRTNQASVDDLAKSVLDYSAAVLEETGSQEQATAVMQTGREELIRTLQQFGLTREEAEAYANQLGLIPENVKTASNFTKDPDSVNYDKQVRSIPHDINTRANFNVYGMDELLEIQSIVREISGTHSVHIAMGTQGGMTMASGGVLTRPSRVLAGEAGPEAIVPLRRPLSQVDPAVRQLSAIAQGMTPMASGGIVGGGGTRTVIVEPGAIVVNTNATNGANIARALLDRIVVDIPA